MELGREDGERRKEGETMNGGPQKRCPACAQRLLCEWPWKWPCQPSSPRPPGSTSHCGISTRCTERCLCVLPLRTSQVPDVMAPQHDQEKFHDLAYSCLGKSFSMSNQDLYGYSTSSLALGLAWLSWETKKKNVLHLVGLDSL
eukprot:XP_011507375.1 protein CROC-4 isoform X4 [Homo sapiens]